MTPAVCVVGELLWDLYADAELAVATRFRRVAGGAAANVATALVAGGVPTAVASVVGGDAFGRGLTSALAAAAIDVSAVVVRSGQTGSVFVEPFRRGGQRFFSYRPSTTWPARPLLPLAWRRGSLRGRRLHIAALSPDELNALASLAVRAARRGAAVSVDLNARPRAWRGVKRTRRMREQLAAVLGVAAWVKASEDDLSVLEVASDRARLGISKTATLIITRGRRASTIVGPHGEARVPSPRVRARFSIGAGDAFSADLLATSLEAPPRTLAAWKEAVRRASRAAVTHLQLAAERAAQ